MIKIYAKNKPKNDKIENPKKKKKNSYQTFFVANHQAVCNKHQWGLALAAW